MRQFLTSILGLILLVATGCSSAGFLPMQDGPKGFSPNQTLGMRHGVDIGSLSPTERYSWLEICDKSVESSFVFFKKEKYTNCEVAQLHQNISQRTTTTGYIAGVVGPVIQTGLTAGAMAYGMHAIGKGIGRSGSTSSTTNNNNSDNSSANTAEGGEGGDGGVGMGGEGGDATATGGDAKAGAIASSSSQSSSKVNVASNTNNSGGVSAPKHTPKPTPAPKPTVIQKNYQKQTTVQKATHSNQINF